MKKVKEVADTSLFDQVGNETPLAEKLFIQNSLDIAHQIILIMEQKNFLQKDLAAGLGKTEAEVSRWLSGFHNFTIKTISKIQAILGEQIIITPQILSDEFSNTLDKIFISFKDTNSNVHFSNLVSEKYSYSAITKTARIIPLSANFESAGFASSANSITGTHL